MVELDAEKLKKLQSTELSMLVEVDRICRKHDIKYSLDGGTLLGAVRHNGFIPWDDDADIVMLRSEYDKFYEACKTELDNSKFFLQEFRTDKNYRWGYSKLRCNDTLFLRTGQEHGTWNQSIFIDIFVYDQVPDNPLLRPLHQFCCFCIRKGLYSAVGCKAAKSLPLRIWYKLLFLIPRNIWTKAIDALSKMNSKKKTELCRHITYPYSRAKYGLPRECFDEFIDKEYEGEKFKIFKKYDLYLSKLYGDYMVLPPVEQRKTHPVTKIKFVGEDVIE